MHKKKRFAQDVGLQIDEIEPGRAKGSLLIEERHQNGTGVVHGGVIFTLADNEDDSLGFMTADDTSFYFTASGRRVGGAELDRVSKAGGTATKIADVGASTPSIDFEGVAISSVLLLRENYETFVALT